LQQPSVQRRWVAGRSSGRTHQLPEPVGELALFLPFADDDPRTAEVLSKVLLLARDREIRDPSILEWIRAGQGG
jgi:hypothetical protein